jgi:hypothetical protein
LKSANNEFLLVTTAQNLRQITKLREKPPPDHGINAPGELKMA